MKYLTDREIHVIGVQRTGQHAITSWLIGHFNNVCYRNGMTLRNERKRAYRGLQPPWWYFKTDKDGWDVSEDIEIRKGMDAIILGTEVTFEDLVMNPMIGQQKKQLEELCEVDQFSRQEDYVLVLRNPFNQFSSVLKWKRNKRLGKERNFSKAWISMAKEILGETHTLPMPKLPVIYDRWFQSEVYRQEISKSLGLDFTDVRLNTVMKIGIGKYYGSSFDRMNKSDRGQEMGVLDRWKEVKDNESFINLTKNEELTEYAKKFGFSI